MTNGEAKIKIRKILMAEIDKLPSHYDTDIGEQVFDNTAEFNELLELNKIVSEAFDAREKQIPKMPKEYEDKFYACPVCGNVVQHKWVKYPTKLMPKLVGLPYCLNCGQRLNWSDEDD